MAYIIWDSSLETGITTIDDQHRKIIDYMNALHAALPTEDREQINKVLEQLVDYTVTHFDFEENLMRFSGYALVDDHKKTHDTFTHRIKQYQERFLQGEDVSRKVLSDLRIWLTNHIQQDDRDYVSVVKDLDKGWVSRTLDRFFGQKK